MNNWFTCKVKYEKEDEKGLMKKVSEPYLVDALSFTEAEARIYQELSSVIRGEFYIDSIAKTKLADVFEYEDSDTWYKCKITYQTVDEKSGKEKKTTNFMLVSAHDVKNAYDRIEESLSTMLVPFEIPSVVESPLVEVFPYISSEQREQQIPDNLVPLDEYEGEVVKHEEEKQEVVEGGAENS